ncbi:hypothetical protein NDU88_007206 [Pleurodeles waltl]|uniref:Uncharacterized protein n=1 Tax=Pleurodeles waltl TaxID=8319 RepID=A0AAV7NVM6_PLEWA|nr:hypothetical protein NDU88_007206 [Pleurodeles waltl]
MMGPRGAIPQRLRSQHRDRASAAGRRARKTQRTESLKGALEEAADTREREREEEVNRHPRGTDRDPRGEEDDGKPGHKRRHGHARRAQAP